MLKSRRFGSNDGDGLLRGRLQRCTFVRAFGQLNLGDAGHALQSDGCNSVGFDRCVGQDFGRDLDPLHVTRVDTSVRHRSDRHSAIPDRNISVTSPVCFVVIQSEALAIN